MVQLREVLASKTKIFIVLELVTGGELFDKLVTEGRSVFAKVVALSFDAYAWTFMRVSLVHMARPSRRTHPSPNPAPPYIHTHTPKTPPPQQQQKGSLRPARASTSSS